jgi:hypothetical protein
LYQPAYRVDELLRGPAKPYVPQEGDIVFFTETTLRWGIPFRLALSGHPYHSGIVVRRPGGDLAILEAGPHDTIVCTVLDLLPRLYGHDGTIWVRQRRLALNVEQSKRLTTFAMNQPGKRFAVLRMAAQLTPLRSRGPLRTRFLGGPHGNRRSYFCSEMVLEACVAAGLLDRHTTRPAATFPRDMFFDASLNPLSTGSSSSQHGGIPRLVGLPLRIPDARARPISPARPAHSSSQGSCGILN